MQNVSNASESPYRVGPQVFSSTLAPTDNILTNYFGPLFDIDLSCIADGTTVSLAAEDGVYLTLAPLPAGRHTIHFTVAGYLDITYELTVGWLLAPAAALGKRRGRVRYARSPSFD